MVAMVVMSLGGWLGRSGAGVARHGGKRRGVKEEEEEYDDDEEEGAPGRRENDERGEEARPTQGRRRLRGGRSTGDGKEKENRDLQAECKHMYV